MRGEQGASTLELAIVAPLLFMLALGIVDLGRALSFKIAVSEAAQEGLNYASYAPDDPTGTVNRVVFSSPDPDFDASNVSVTCLSDPAEHVAVVVEQDLDLMTPFVSEIMGGSLEITSTAIGETFSEATCIDS